MGRPAMYSVCLTEAERKLLSSKCRSKSVCSTIKSRIKILLNMDQNCPKPLTREQCAAKVKVALSTVKSTIKLFCQEGLDGILSIKRNPNSDTASQKFDGKDQARIIATACLETTDGSERWTVRGIADYMSIALEKEISPSTVSRILKKNEIRPHLKEYWCIPAEKSAEFVAAMEEVLDTYAKPDDPKYPVWCLDEKPYQLLGEAREPIPMKQGSPKRVDAEYVRNGHVAIFVMIKPGTGRIHKSVLESRKAVDFAHQIKWIVDVAEPDAEKVIIVLDNLNTHKIASLYKAFPPEEAARIRNKVDFRYTPVHGSWLNIAEIAINIVTRQCLGQRFSDIDTLRSTLDTWEQIRNRKNIKIDWKFTTEDARVKLKRLYPEIES